MELSSMYEQDVSLPVDMAEMGVRPMGWFIQGKNLNLDDSNHGLFCTEKSTQELTVFSAEIQSFHSNSKITTNEESVSMSDEDDGDYDIDPETGEKSFHAATLTISNTLLSPSNTWLEEYLSNLESASNELLPATTTDLMLNDVPSLFQDTDWFSSLMPLDENEESLPLAGLPLLTSPFNIDLDEKPSLSSSSPIFVSSSSEQDQGLFSMHPLNNLTEDDYSTGSNNDYFSRPTRFFPSIESDNETSLLDAKLEKIDPEDSLLTNMMVRRSSLRSTTQGPQDDETLLRHQIPLTVHDITQSSTEEYNQHLTRLSHLSTEQIHIIKDIRRRGKNKLAAQNCRKRKAVGVETLLEEVDELKRVKQELKARKRAFEQQITDTRRQYEHLHRQVLPDRKLPPAITVK